MINVQIAQPMATGTTIRTLRSGNTTFWLLVGLQALLIAGVLLWYIGQHPAATPLSKLTGVQRVRDYVLAGDNPHDALIEVTPGLTAHASSLRGLQIDGATYYYYFEGQHGGDPLSRGTVRPDQVEILYRESGDQTTLVVYQVLANQ